MTNTKSKSVSGKTYKNCGHWRYFRGAHAPIIAYGSGREAGKIWDEYRARRVSVARTPIRARPSAVRHDITGLPRCQLCRGAMGGHGKREDVFWRCARHDAGSDCEGATGTGSELDRIVMEFLEGIADDVDEQPPAEEDAPVIEPSVEHELAELRIEHAGLQEALSRLIIDYAKNPQRYPADAYDSARQDLESDRDGLAARIAEIGGDEELEAEEETPPTREEMRPLAVGMLPGWKTFTAVQRNLILKQVIRCIRVYPRPSRYETRAEVIPVWAPLDDGKWGR
ncbi:hypothetical protein [Streptomyces axinellae]|uniref:hypothetical protein n=1 Tax=Streptomyces axinellae TaxID=552788 RepID=UPI0031DA6145